MTIPIRIPEVMTRFACNQKGCCCKGWDIWWDAGDTRRLMRRFPPEQRQRILSGAQQQTFGDDPEPRRIQLRRDGDDECQFLAHGGACAIHAAVGPEPLPLLCRTFPAFAYAHDERRELHYDAICPSVLDQLDESDGPYEILERDVAPESDLGVRARRPQKPPAMAIAGRTLDVAQVHAMRGAILSALNDPGRAALAHLARIAQAVARLVDGRDAALDLTQDVDDAAFARFFDACVEAHHPAVLASFVRDYRRFVFTVDYEGVSEARLTELLVYDAGWREVVDPRQASLQPLLRRYLAHRFFCAYERAPRDGDVSFAFGATTHTLATAFRVVVALCRALERPPDRHLMKIGIGVSELLARTLRLPSAAMPWFDLAPPAPALE